MSNFTSGPLAVTIAQLETKASLASISGAMVKQRPSYKGLIPGWGSIHDSDDNLADFAPAPTPGDPTIEAATGQYAERLFARLYYWVPDRNAKRYAPTADLQRVSRLRACDFMLTRISATSVLVAISTRNQSDLEHIAKPSLQAAVLGVDQNAQLLLDTSPLDLNTPDIFMWLLQRYDENRQLTGTLELANVREITSRDPLSRGANLSQGVDLSRRELLALITNDAIAFGPAKLVTYESVSDGYIDMELFVDGGFAVHTGESHYKDVMGRSVIGPRTLEDLVFAVVPSLRSAYQSDKAWQAGGRKKFIAKCLGKLKA